MHGYAHAHGKAYIPLHNFRGVAKICQCSCLAYRQDVPIRQFVSAGQFTSRQFGSNASSKSPGSRWRDKCSSCSAVQFCRFSTQLTSLSSKYSFCRFARFPRPSIFCIWFFCMKQHTSLHKYDHVECFPLADTAYMTDSFQII